MRRPPVPRHLPLVALVVVTAITVPAAATIVGDQTAALATPGNETVSQLRLPDPGVNERQRPSGDIAGVLQAEEEKLQSTLETRAFDRTFDAALERQSRLETIEAEIEDLEATAVALREARTDAVRAYERGELTRTALFRELVRLRTAAVELNGRIERLKSTVESSADVSLSSELSVRLSSVRSHLISLNGPVTEELASVVRGKTQPRSIYVTAGQDGLVLSMIDDGQFVREATVWSARGESGPDQFVSGTEPAPAAAYGRIEELYPWASSNLVSSPSLTGIGDTPIYVVGLTHRHGELTAYLDGRTTDVFYEVQRLSLSSLPVTTVATNATESLSVTVDMTFKRGPVAVSVTDGSGQTIDATITVGNQTVGSTGEDGRLWLVDTDGAEHITARTDDGDRISVVAED
ncbi:MAG: hypothetical protein ABEI98_10980 [Halorhabdus sp.]